MYCIKCGVKLEETERVCPLCSTLVSHPDFPPAQVIPLYPKDKLPQSNGTSKILCGALIIVDLMFMAVSLIADLHANGRLDWFGYAAGALLLCYIALALPLWFKKPNPVIFVPCSFVASAVYLQYINWATAGNWFLPFALPVIGGLCLITCSVLSLLYYLKRGRLYIFGGALILLGGFALLMEYLLSITFGILFIGWSVYPLVVLVSLGGLLIYLGICRPARQVLERNLFF